MLTANALPLVAAGKKQMPMRSRNTGRKEYRKKCKERCRKSDVESGGFGARLKPEELGSLQEGISFLLCAFPSCIPSFLYSCSALASLPAFLLQ
jgi:hypothetical protein